MLKTTNSTSITSLLWKARFVFSLVRVELCLTVAQLWQTPFTTTLCHLTYNGLQQSLIMFWCLWRHFVVMITWVQTNVLQFHRRVTLPQGLEIKGNHRVEELIHANYPGPFILISYLAKLTSGHRPVSKLFTIKVVIVNIIIGCKSLTNLRLHLYI